MMRFLMVACWMAEEIREVKRAADLFSDTDEKCERAFCAYGAVAIKNSIVERKRRGLDSPSFSHGGAR
jgi:hypothetical protein